MKNLYAFAPTLSTTLAQKLRGAGLLALGAGGLLVLGLFTAAAPWAIAFLLMIIAMLGGAFALLAYATAGAPSWIRACAAVVMAQLVLNYGFATAVIPLGPVGLPVSELVLVLSLVCCAYHLFLAKEPVRLPLLILMVCLWAVLTLALHLPAGYQQFGLPAARDALPTVEVLFVLPGFVAASLLMRLPDGGRSFMARCLAVFVLAVAAYGLLIGAQDILSRYSPRLPSLQQSVPVLGSFQTWPLVGLLGMLGYMLWRWQDTKPPTLTHWLIALLIFASGAYAFFASQSRASYVIIAFFLLILMVIGGQVRRVMVLLGALLCALLVLLLVETMGLELKGRIATLSATQIFDHILTLSGTAEGTEYQGAAGGIAQRRAWIDYSLNLWQRDLGSMVFGVGYGEVLTNHIVTGFQGQTILVREPHNSFVSILTRTGAIGLIVNAALHTTILLACIAFYRLHYRQHRALAGLALGVLFLHTFCLLMALGQPLLESPHFAVPLHFILGAMYAVSQRDRRPPQPSAPRAAPLEALHGAPPSPGTPAGL